MTSQNRTTRRLVMGLALVTAFAGLGIAMPSCPGQQAMQQQIDTLQSQAADHTKKLQSLDSRIGSATNEVAQFKGYIEQMNKAIQVHEAALNELTNAMKAMQAKLDQMAAAAAQPKGKGAKKRH